MTASAEPATDCAPAEPNRTVPRTIGALALVLLLLAALWTWMPACGRNRENPAPADGSHPALGDTLLVVDGVTVTFADIAEPMAFLDRLYPEFNERLKIQKVLTQFTLPLLFARLEFKDQRRQQLGLARTFKLACGNVAELDRNSEGHPRRRAILTAGDLDLPIAAFLFDPATTGAVSEPIEVPQGFVVAGAFDLMEEREVIKDRCDALQVLFLTHPASIWAEWLAQLRVRIGDRATYVHPDYRLAMPPWIKQP